MSLVADKIIIGDYLVPPEKGLRNIINNIVEILAGRNHYKNFNTFTYNGGINGIINKSMYKVYKEIKNKPETSHLVAIKH